MQGEEHPTPVAAARVIGSLTGDLAPSWRPASFSPSSTICSPPAAGLPPLRTPDDLNQAIDMCLDDCVVKFNRYGAHQGGPAAAHGLPLAGQLHPACAFLRAHGAHRPRPHGKRRLCALPCWRSSIPSRWSAPRGRPSPPPRLPRPPGWRSALRNGGSRAAAAAELGISKTTLWRRMKQYGIRDRFEGIDQQQTGCAPGDTGAHLPSAVCYAKHSKRWPMRRFQRHGHEIKGAWAETAHMRINSMRHKPCPFRGALWRRSFIPGRPRP